ncbi:MAG: glycosyltransferase family 2 protein [Candidatus Omnitrophica bacterium]|nr:glycosyltransferase family 2 protein [Candidatus Omnitrophota bacterium]
MKVCVVIPAYNEAKKIGLLIRQIKEQGLEVVLVDDGSKDNTSRVAAGAGAVVVGSEVNRGKGASLVKGFEAALGRGCDAVIAMDGDGQHLPQDIRNFIEHAENFEGDLLVGNRMHAPHRMPLLRLVTNKCMSLLISLLSRQHIPDTQCGFRLIKRAVLENLNLVTTNYEIESEMLIKAARLRYKIRSIPVSSVYRGEKSYINPWVDTVRFFKYLCIELCTRARK